MKKSIFIITLLVTYFYSNGQNSKTGIIYYDHIDNHYGVSYNAYLVFNESKSNFVTAMDSLGMSGEQKNTEDGTIVEASDFNDLSKTRKHGLQVFLDKSSDSLYFSNAFSLTSRTLLVKEKKPQLKWILEKESKKIGKFNCNKATVNFRGRKYICWYTEEIPLSYGPWKLQGLPGMIIEARSEDNFFVIRFKEIKYPITTISVPKHQDELLFSNKKYISFDEYKLKQKQEIEDATNQLRIAAKKYGVQVQPLSERDNFLEIFGQ